MNRKAVSGTMLTLLLMSMLTLAFNIQPVKASGTIYIRPNGDVDPPTAPIQRDGDIYTFTDNIYDEIVVERSNIVIEGAGYTLQGSESGYGFFLSGINNVTIKNMEIKGFGRGIQLYAASNNNSIYGNNITNNLDGIFIWSSNNNKISRNNITNNAIGIYLSYSSNNTISGNNITNNRFGIQARGSCNNTISGNNITNNNEECGIVLLGSSNNNSISGNNITNNIRGIYVYGSSNNIIFGNNLANNREGIYLCMHADNNLVYHNSFMNNIVQVVSPGANTMWDDGYPSGGNYWSDYEERYPSAEELDDSGIWDHPYVIDADNQDRYPLVNPWAPTPTLILGKDVPAEAPDFFTSVLTKLNIPTSEFAVQALTIWTNYENTNAYWNPLATTLPMGEKSWDFNEAGVKNYADKETGIQATANTLGLQYYESIREMLAIQSFNEQHLREAVATWSGLNPSDSYVINLVTEWRDIYPACAQLQLVQMHVDEVTVSDLNENGRIFGDELNITVLPDLRTVNVTMLAIANSLLNLSIWVRNMGDSDIIFETPSIVLTVAPSEYESYITHNEYFYLLPSPGFPWEVPPGVEIPFEPPILLGPSECVQVKEHLEVSEDCPETVTISLSLQFQYCMHAIYVDPQSIVDPNLTPGSTFSITIKVKDFVDIYGCGFWLAYDTSVLTATSIDETPNIFQDGEWTPDYALWQKKINDTAGAGGPGKGVAKFALTEGLGEPSGVDGGGLVANITFTVDALGQSDLELHGPLNVATVEIIDSFGVVIPHNEYDGYFNNSVGVIKYELTIEVVGSGTTAPSPDIYTINEGNEVIVAAVPDPEYMLDHWELNDIDVGDANPYTVTMDADYTLIAFFSPQPDFEISVSPPSQTVGIAESVEYEITVTSINDFESEVSLYVLASYADLGIEFYPSEVTPPPSGTTESTLTITTTGSTPCETFEIEIFATGGGITKNDHIKLSVEISLEVPYQSQGYTMWCGPTSLAMMLRYYGEEFHSWDYALDKNLPTSWQTAIEPPIGEGLEDYIEQNYPDLAVDIRYYWPWTKEEIFTHLKSDISNGFPLILNVGSPPIHQIGHFVVVVGFNDTGIFLNDPSGALFTVIMQPPTSRASYCHAYVDWSKVEAYIATRPLASTMTLKGIPDPNSRFGTMYITSRHDIRFYQPEDHQLNDDHYELTLNQGLNWMLAGAMDPVVDKKCDSLYAHISVSNCRHISQPFTAFCRILCPNDIVHPLGAKEMGAVRAFGEGGTLWQVEDLENLLLKGGPYYLEFDLVDSNGLTVDHFVTQPFYWDKAQSIKLKEKQQHLYLHVYDEEGNHVGLNYATNETELGIQGSYYHDNGNGTTIIVLPQIINLTIVVDAKHAEDPVESYNLTVTLTTDFGVFSETCLGNITAGESQTFSAQVSEVGLELYMHTDVDIDPDTLNLRSNGEWVTAYIELPAGYNLSNVDISTVQMNNTISVDSSAPTQIGDYDLDGVPDLMVKFDRASIIEWLGAIDYSEETGKSCLITVSVTGNVLDVLFEGLDTIKMLHK